LEKEGILDPLQESFVTVDAMQCGYCVPGAIMTAKALLLKNPNPDEESVKKALSGVICRCGAHTRMVDAVLEVC
jgi:carbon-monoxide dehydrogenase small subunit